MASTRTRRARRGRGEVAQSPAMDSENVDPQEESHVKVAQAMEAMLEEAAADMRAEAELLGKKLMADAKQKALKLKNAFHVEMMKIPSKIKKMPWKQFVEEYQGSMDNVFAKQMKLSMKKHHDYLTEGADEKGGTLKMPAPNAAGTVRASRRKPGAASRNAPSTGQKKRKPVAQTPSTRTRSKRNQQGASAVAFTPAHSTATALQTPATRRAKGGEVLFSQNGSPVELAAGVSTVVRGAGAGSSSSDVAATPFSSIVMSTGVDISDTSNLKHLHGEEKIEANEKLAEMLAAVQAMQATLLSNSP